MKEFPGAKIVASSYDAFLSELDKVRSALPVVTQEMGDTWIYGVPSDPLKNAKYRAANRLREACLASGSCDNSDARIQNFTRLFLKNPEVGAAAPLAARFDRPSRARTHARTHTRTPTHLRPWVLRTHTLPFSS